MKRHLAVIVSVALAVGAPVLAQAPPPAGQKTLAATMNVYAFPTKGQTPEQQSQDEAACYTYATQSTGADPFALQKQAQQQQQQAAQQKEQVKDAGQGAGAKGAVAGAAAGAIIGGVTGGNAAASAGYGAAAGAVIARRRTREKQAEATEQINQQSAQAQQATQQQIDNFKKAFSVCLEAKDYMVKY